MLYWLVHYHIKEGVIKVIYSLRGRERVSYVNSSGLHYCNVAKKYYFKRHLYKYPYKSLFVKENLQIQIDI